jgi:hypothetical protein
MNDRDALSLLLTSKTLSTLLDAKNKLWKELMQPRLDKESLAFIQNDDYQKIWRKKASLNIDFSNMIIEPVQEIKAKIPSTNTNTNTLFDIYSTLFTQKISNIDSIEFKEVDKEKINQFIKQDNDLALLYEASRLGTIITSILTHDIAAANTEVSKLKINEMKCTLYDADFHFILYLMPHIIDSHASKCFRLFIQTFYFGHELYATYSKLSDIKDILFPKLKILIFNSNNAYFIYKFIELTFLYSSDTFFVKNVIQTCAEKKLIHLLLQALTESEISIEKYSWLLEDDDVSEIVKQGNQFMRF